MPELVPATINHAVYIANCMRPEEVLEVRLATDYSPHEATINSLRSSTVAASMLVDQIPVGMSGLTEVSKVGKYGNPWLLTTPMMKKYPIFLVKNTIKFIDIWLDYKPILQNFVHAEYIDSLRWAKACGFTVYEAEPYGVWGEPFHKIEIRRD